MQMDAADTETGVPGVVSSSLAQFDNRQRYEIIVQQQFSRVLRIYMYMSETRC